jgi:hypothetical protein
MVPFHDSDVAENRWREGEWRQFELWERIEHRFRRKRVWTVVATVILFLALLSIPIIRDRAPKWVAENAVRKLAIRANQMKVDSAALGVPLRLRLEPSPVGLEYVIEKVEACPRGAVSGTAKAPQEWTRGPVFSKPKTGVNFVVLSPERASELGLERVVSSLCYEPVLEPVVSDSPAIAYSIGILTAKDLTEGRLDRMAFLNFSGLSTEIDFD